MPDGVLNPLAPADLGAAGRRTWAATVASVAEGWELDERDLELLGQAARQADLVAELEAAVERYGVIIEGAQGQLKANPAAPALTAARALLARLLAQVEIAPPAERTGHLNRNQRHVRKVADWRAQGKVVG